MDKDKMLDDIAVCRSIANSIKNKLHDLEFKLDIMEQELLCDDEEEDEDEYYTLTPRGKLMVELMDRGFKYEEAQAITDKIDWSDQ